MNRVRLRRAVWLLAAVGLITTALLGGLHTASFPYAWLAALTAWLGWPLGCMGLLLTHALTGGRWGYALRPQWLAGMGTLPLLLPALLPLLPLLPALYPWARPDAAAHLHNAGYLNLPQFALRGACYLLIWFGLAYGIRRALRQPQPQAALARIAPAGLILLVLSLNFAAIDTTMSLDPDFNSSAYGLIAVAAAALLALSVALFAATFTAVPYPRAGICEPRTGSEAAPAAPHLRNDLGQLLLGLMLLWVYLDFMQVLIVWQSDLASDAPWYVVRTHGSWGAVATVIAVGHFVLPFPALLWPRLRRSRTGIRLTTAVLLLGEIARSWWLVIPAYGTGLNLSDAAAMLGLLALAAALALRPPAGRPLAITAGAGHA